MRRRSVSSLVSPGPRVPMPPPSRESSDALAGQARQQVVELRQLHLQPALAVRARRAKMSRISWVRSSVLRSDRLLQVALLGRRQLVVEEHEVGPASARDRRGDLLDLAAADERRGVAAACAPGSGLPTTSAPALSASSASSSSGAFGAGAARGAAEARPTSRAFSRFVVRLEVDGSESPQSTDRARDQPSAALHVAPTRPRRTRTQARLRAVRSTIVEASPSRARRRARARPHSPTAATASAHVSGARHAGCGWPRSRSSGPARPHSARAQRSGRAPARRRCRVPAVTSTGRSAAAAAPG